ncbi:PEP-CTERM sorting domain-containing protein [Microcoleus sp. AT9_B5]
MRLLATTTLVCLLLAQGICAKAKAATINLTHGQWEVTGSDIANWNGSDLVFETQVANGADFDITGHFDWYSNETYRGRELFSGTYTSNGFLDFSGFQLINPISIQLSDYQAEVLSTSQIGNGTWRTGSIKGTWAATNPTAILEPNLPPTATVVPEPSSILSVGIAALAGTIFKRRIKRKAVQ